MTSITIRAVSTKDDLEAVRCLCWDYRAYLENFSDELKAAVDFAYPAAAYETLMDSLPEKHARPKGIMFLAEADGQAIGCGMSHALNDQDTEIKRVFVSADARGSGAGKKISKALIDQARSDGFRRILLDTSRQFTGPQRLYESLGFQRRGPYSELPEGFEEYLVFYELTL